MRNIVMAVPFRTNYYNAYAKVLHSHDKLKACYTWTRNSIPGIPQDYTTKFPVLGLCAYIAARTLSMRRAESLRFSMYPLFDKWVSHHLVPGDHIISSYAYANTCFDIVRKNGGNTYLDAGNSHPDNFWEILSEEHRRWNVKHPPVPHFYINRAKETVAKTDFVLSPSQFVTNSFLQRGFTQNQIIPILYPANLEVFKPKNELRPDHQPLTIINTGGFSFRKGTPYLFEAYREIRKTVPNARLMVTGTPPKANSFLANHYSDLPIEWIPFVPHQLLAKRLQSADLFIFPSLEDGWARTVTEAMACGLPVIVTKNTGACDDVIQDVNGSIVPIRDPIAIATAAIAWWNRLREGYRVDTRHLSNTMSMESLAQKLSPLII